MPLVLGDVGHEPLALLLRLLLHLQALLVLAGLELELVDSALEFADLLAKPLGDGIILFALVALILVATDCPRRCCS